MTDDESRGRYQEHRVDIDAPPDTVWQALTEADQLVRWFAPDAEVEPGVGGKVWASWGPAAEGTSRITVWEPGRHLRLVQDRSLGQEGDDPARAVEVAVDFHLEGEGGRTVLRVVQSGFGSGDTWDAEFEATEAGWRVFLKTLKLALEEHADKPCRRILVTAETALPLTDAWAQLMGPSGFLAAGSLEDLVAGATFHTETANGRTLSGTTEVVKAPTGPEAPYAEWAAFVDEMGPALAWLTLMPRQGQTLVSYSLTTYGLAPERAAAIEDAFSSLIGDALPSAP